MAVKDDGELFGGKGSYATEAGRGTQVAYRKLQYLNSAMTNAKVNKDEYSFFKITFDGETLSSSTELIKQSNTLKGDI